VFTLKTTQLLNEFTLCLDTMCQTCSNSLASFSFKCCLVTAVATEP